jgi:Protein of unknown function (DUF3574)
MRTLHVTMILILLSCLTGCVSTGGLRCATGEQRRVASTLYFGTDRASGAITPDEWNAFLDEAVTPRFPQGLTVTEASGQWRMGDGEIVREASRALTLIHANDSASRAAIVDIIREYKSKFDQEAVLNMRTPACVSF